MAERSKKLPLADSLTSIEILENNLRGKRTEYISVDNILAEQTLIDEIHMDDLAESIYSDDQYSPILVRARMDEGKIVYDIADGFHRVGAIKKLQQIYEDAPELIEAKVLYGYSDEELYDIRVLAANSVSSISFARLAQWMHESFRVQNWNSQNIKDRIETGKLKLHQVFNLAVSGSSGKNLGLSLDETQEVQNWAKKKARKWKKSVFSINQELNTVEITDPNLIKMVTKNKGGGKDKAATLTHAKLNAIAVKVPHDYEAQNLLVKAVLRHHLIAEQASDLTEMYLQTNPKGELHVKNLLEDPLKYLPSVSGKKRKENYTTHVHHSLNEHSEEETQILLQIIDKQQELLERYKPDISQVIYQRINKHVTFQPNNNLLLLSEENKTILLTETESKILNLLISFKGTIIPPRVIVYIALGYNQTFEEDAEELIRPHLSNLRIKLKEISPLLGDNIFNIRGRGYNWVGDSE